MDLGKDPDLSRLLANFAREGIKRRGGTPSWNLALVLDCLAKTPFEPLESVHLKFVTFKSVFLLAFASGNRRSEIHALTKEFLRTDDWSELTLFTDSNFIAKTELARTNASSRGLVIPALNVSGSTETIDHSLCPVRALKWYMERTKAMRGDRKKLFISYKKGFSGEIAKATISQWIKKTVMLAYELAKPDGLADLSVKAHDVRGLAASWARLSNVSLDEVMSACSWRSHNTFTNFYLKDLARVQEDMYKLGPLIAAKHLTQAY